MGLARIFPKTQVLFLTFPNQATQSKDENEIWNNSCINLFYLHVFFNTGLGRSRDKSLTRRRRQLATFADRTGQGLSHQLITAAFSIEHIQVESLVVPYSRALMMARKGQVQGVFNVTRERSTEPDFLFGEEPLFVANASFYYNRNRPLNAQNKWQLPRAASLG